VNEETSLYRREFPIEGGDFNDAGRASTDVKAVLKEVGFGPEIIRRAAIAAFEAEMNVVMYAKRGTMVLEVTPSAIGITVADEGPGIPDIDLAMQEGYSTASDELREMGFGAGMGLPNIRRNADVFHIESNVGAGTFVQAVINIPGAD
jgi:anti-sigma regulatory factor (Ser/Thr protein kinase)